MNDVTATPPLAAKLPWSTPRLEPLGSMHDVKANVVQPPNDGSFSPTVAAS